MLSIFFSILRNFYSIFRFTNANNIGIIHGNDLRINLTWSFPIIFTSSKYVWHQRQVLSKSIKWRLIKYLSNHLITISDYVHRSIPANIKTEFNSCINNPFNVSNLYDKQQSRDRVNSIYNISDSDILIGYIGRLVSWKHVEDILYALSSIISLNLVDKIHLLIVGTGDNEYIEQIISIIDSENLTEYVTMTGFVNNPYPILSSLDLLIASSHNEPFGRVLIESMLQKTPVLSSDSGAHTEIIIHGVNGFLYNEGSSESMHKAIVNIVLGRVSKNKIVEVAYRHSIHHYSAVAHAKKVVTVYSNLTEE